MARQQPQPPHPEHPPKRKADHQSHDDRSSGRPRGTDGPTPGAVNPTPQDVPPSRGGPGEGDRRSRRGV